MIVAAGGDALLLAELGAVILACGLLARLAGRLSLSPIPFYLLVGLLINESAPLHVDAGREFIEPAAAIGVVLLLFTLGLEYTPTELTSGLRTNWLGGLVDLVANGAPGYVFGVLLGLDAPQSLALAGVTYISSSGIIAKLLGDLGRTGNRETPIVLSILVIEDLVMAFYLPLLAGVLAGGSTGSTAASVALAVAAVVVVLLGSMWGGPTLSRLVFARSPEVLLLTVLGLALLVAGAAEALQVSAAVGAFLVGIALSGEAAERAEPLLMPLRDVFAAAFFLLFALEIDLTAIPETIGPALGLALVTSATKLGTGWWTARRAGIANRGRWRTGATLIARGEFSIVIAGLAVLADPTSRIGAVAASYVLILALAGPIAARYSDEAVAWFMRRRVAPAV
ncbi:MAG: cation:proton antiporter [Acidimicrobiales bacterium]